METNRTERLNNIVSTLSAYIDALCAYDMEETAELLRVVKLDLQMRIHGITNEELKALCDVLEVGRMPAAPAAEDEEDADGFPSTAVRLASTVDDILLQPRLHSDVLRRRQGKRGKPM
jgi:hypothetical protein